MQLLINAALPQDCALCLAPADALVCGACLASLPRDDAHSTRTVAAFEYRFPADRLVQRFKFAGDLAIGRWLALQLASRVRGEPRPDLLVCPPLTRGRLIERGFNQSVEIARVVGRELGLRHAPRALRKVRETAPQHGLGRRERKANLRGAFRCERPLRGLRVAIVDDVITTGATADALAAVLRGSGARDVVVWALARAPRPGS